MLHEPPILTYEKYENYDKAQKWFKDNKKSPSDLDWKSGMLNFIAEQTLIEDYKDYVESMLWSTSENQTSDTSDDKQKKFYQGLLEVLKLDWCHLVDEGISFSWPYGKRIPDLMWLAQEIRVLTSKEGPPPGCQEETFDRLIV